MVSPERFQKLARQPLLQHGNLPKTGELNPNELTTDTLKRALQLGREFCRTGYHLVAFSQFDPDVLRQAGIPKTQTRLIYASPATVEYFPFPDSLLINPTISPAPNQKFLMCEACGSLEKGKLYYWLYRPLEVDLSCLLWKENTDSPQPINVHIYADGAGMLEHEIDHLRGLTAADRPTNILDFRSLTAPTHWEEAGFVWDKGTDHQKAMADISPEWLIYDQKERRHLVVDPRGETIRVFSA